MLMAAVKCSQAEAASFQRLGARSALFRLCWLLPLAHLIVAPAAIRAHTERISISGLVWLSKSSY